MTISQARKAFKDGKKVTVTFKAATRSHYKKATRIVQSFDGWGGYVIVRYHGWDNFAVRGEEIITFGLKKD